MEEMDLPSLPAPKFKAGTKIGTYVSFFTKDPSVTKGVGLYTEEQVRQAQIEAVEVYRDRQCPDKDMGEFSCSNRFQCWEPCGELGKSELHARVVYLTEEEKKCLLK